MSEAMASRNLRHKLLALPAVKAREEGDEEEKIGE